MERKIVSLAIVLSIAVMGSACQMQTPLLPAAGGDTALGSPTPIANGPVSPPATTPAPAETPTTAPSAPTPSAPVTVENYPVSNAASNIANGGFMCETNDAIYVVEDKEVSKHDATGSSFAVDNQIWTETRSRTNSKPSSKIHDMIEAMTCDDTYLYFSDWLSIYRISLKSGKESAKPIFRAGAAVRAVGGMIQYLTVYGGRVYFILYDYITTSDTDGTQTLYSMKPDGSDLRKRLPGNTAFDFTIANDKMYYFAQSQIHEAQTYLYQADLDFKTTKEIAAVGSEDSLYTDNLQAEGSDIYYNVADYDNSGKLVNMIHRIDKHGKDSLLASAPYTDNGVGSMFSFTVNQGVVYYVSGKRAYSIYNPHTNRSADGAGIIELSSTRTEGLYVVAGHVFIGANTVENS